MFPKQLESLLHKDGFLPDNLNRSIVACDDWFMEEPTGNVITFRAILKELRDAWGDDEGIDSRKIAPYENLLYPQIQAYCSDLLDGVPPRISIDQLTRTLRDCRVKASRVPLNRHHLRV